VMDFNISLFPGKNMIAAAAVSAPIGNYFPEPIRPVLSLPP